MRGFAAVTDFAYRMLSTLNHPRNAAKGCWSQMTFDDLVDKLHEERREVDESQERRQPMGDRWDEDVVYKCQPG